MPTEDPAQNQPTPAMSENAGSKSSTGSIPKPSPYTIDATQPSIHETVASLTAENAREEPAWHQANNLVIDSDEATSASETDDTDSALGGSLRISTVSLSESVTQFREENGRTYHGYKDGKYVLPNDESETERLDLQHHMFLLTLDGKLHLAPIKGDIQRALDFGTGTGIWAIDFAQQFPAAEVIGTDLSPIQPLYVPPNVRFEICDAEEEWDFSQPFDYVHGRMMTVCFEDVSLIFREAFKSLRSGGWLEMQDIRFPIRSDDGTVENNPVLKRWNESTMEGARRLGRPWDQGDQYIKHLQAAGFVDITEVRYDWALSPWPKNPKDKEIGLWCRENFQAGIQGVSMAVLTRGMGWTREEVELFLVDVRREMLSKRVHAYVPLYFVYARKP